MDLSTRLPYRGTHLTLANPLILASGTCGYALELAPYGDLASIGAFSLKGVSLQPRAGNPTPRMCEVPCGMINSIGLQNCGVQVLIQEILPKLAASKATVFANLYANSVEEFVELTTILHEQESICAFELNVSCPNVKEGGVAFGQDPSVLAKVVTAVVKASPKKPVCVKLTPNVTDIAYMATVAEEAGADFISCINTIHAMSVDIRTRKPRLASIHGGLSGACIKPIALYCVHKIVQAVSIPVIGIGGIHTAEDLLEFILVGASAVQMGTATFYNPTTPFTLMTSLKQLCTELGITDLTAYRNSLNIE